MVKIQTRPWDVAEHLETDEDMAAYLEAALKKATRLWWQPPWGILPAPKGWRKSPGKRV